MTDSTLATFCAPSAITGSGLHSDWGRIDGRWRTAVLAVSAAPLNSRWGAVRYRAGATGEVT